VKIRTSGYQTLERLLQHSQLGVLRTWVKRVTGLQILGFKLHKNALGEFLISCALMSKMLRHVFPAHSLECVLDPYYYYFFDPR